MLEEFTKFHDLTQFFGRIHGFNKYKSLYSALKIVQDAHSVQKDIDVCRKLLNLAISLVFGELYFPHTEEGVKDAIVGSLFCNALIHYVRATKSSSRHRKTFSFTLKWDENLRAKHEQLARLRDDAVAHFGPGPSAFWVDERLILCSDDRDVMLKFLNTRYNYRQYYLEILDLCSSRASDDIQTIFDRKGEIAAKACIEMSADEEIIAIIRDCSFQPEAYLTSKEAIDQFKAKKLNFDNPITSRERSERPPNC